MSPGKTLEQKTPDELKAEYYTAIFQLMDKWQKIAPPELPTKQQEMEITIWEEVAYTLAREMKKRGMFVIKWSVLDE